MSNKQTVKNILERDGEITNFWCIENRILRLSDIIFRLKNEGMEIETEYKGSKGNKNCKYILKRKETLF